MPGTSIVVLEDSPRLGLENMEIDNRLLLEANDQKFLQDLGLECGSAPLIVRFYYWSEPTLSLGNFQSLDQLEESPDTRGDLGLKDLAWVQRKTGGGAILHDREITYSIIVPGGNSSMPLASKGHSEQLYRAVHESVVRGLIEMGFDAKLSEACSCSISKGDSTGQVRAREVGHEDKAASLDVREPFLCFHRRTPVDVVVGDYKVLGSAQRRGKNGLLQHGSLLLKKSTAYPKLFGLSDLAHLPQGYQIGPYWPNSPASRAWQDWLESRIFQAIERLIGGVGEVFRLNLHDRSVRI